MKKTLKDYIQNIPKSVKSAVAGLGLLAMVSAVNLPPLYADKVFSEENKDAYRIEATIDVVPFNTQVQGLEENMGASGEMYGELSELGEAELNPIKLNPTVGTFNIPKTLIKPQISIYTPSNIGFHMGGWQFSGNDLKNGEVSSLSAPDPLTESDEFFVGIVSMWDQIFFSHWSERNTSYDEETDTWTNELEFGVEGGELKTKYECSRNFKLLNGSLFASIPIIPAIRVFGGLSFNLFEINDMQRVQPTIHSESHHISNYIDGSFYTWDRVYHNNMTLEVNSNIKAQGLGPMVGLTGSQNITDWLKVYGDFSKSWIRLKTQRNANFLSIDDISGSQVIQEYDSGGNLIAEDIEDQSQYTEENFPFAVDKAYNLSQTEFNLGLEFLLGKHVTLSAGYWKNIMQGIPKPATFRYTGDAENPYAWAHESEAKDIAARGFKVGVGIKY